MLLVCLLNSEQKQVHSMFHLGGGGGGGGENTIQRKSSIFPISKEYDAPSSLACAPTLVATIPIQTIITSIFLLQLATIRCVTCTKAFVV